MLITGEHGTGKEVVARWLHAASPRANRPLVIVNAGGLSEGVFESELFGHVKGAFTGAGGDKEGKFVQADGGTIFLDEVGDMSPKTQAKVLRVLEQQSFSPVGSNATVRVDVRVIASTNKNLEREIERGNFREDLYYRLNVIPFEIPPLRERKEDILPLAAHFLDQFARKYRRKPPALGKKAIAVLESYDWPGNVRELRNIMERIVIMTQQPRIDVCDLPEAMLGRALSAAPAPEDDSTLHAARERFERDFILQKLVEHRGNISRAAEALGIERSNLYRKLRQLGIPWSGRDTDGPE